MKKVRKPAKAKIVNVQYVGELRQYLIEIKRGKLVPNIVQVIGASHWPGMMREWYKERGGEQYYEADKKEIQAVLLSAGENFSKSRGWQVSYSLMLSDLFCNSRPHDMRYKNRFIFIDENYENDEDPGTFCPVVYNDFDCEDIEDTGDWVNSREAALSMAFDMIDEIIEALAE